jgi:hypothetical protein
MLRRLMIVGLSAGTGLSVFGGLLAAPPANPGDGKAVPGAKADAPSPAEAEKARAEALAKADKAEREKVARFLEHLRTSTLPGLDDAKRKAVADKWAGLKDAPVVGGDDFILETLADLVPQLSDALEMVESGAYTGASRKLSELLAAAKDPYLESHVRYYLARIKFGEGDWPTAAKDLGELLQSQASRMTLEYEVAYYHARALANIAPKEQRQEVAQRFADFITKYPHAKTRYLAAAADLAKEVAKTLPVIRGDSLTNVAGGPEELPNFAKDLRNIEKRISVPIRDTGKTTQKLQADALAYLDNLIDKAEQQQNQQQQQQKKDQDKKDQDKKDQDQKQQSKDQQQGENQQQPEDQQGKDQKDQKDQAKDPRKNSQLPQSGKPKDGKLADIEKLRARNFGTLPPEEVNRIIEEALRTGKIPEKYAKVLELYNDEQTDKRAKK